MIERQPRRFSAVAPLLRVSRSAPKVPGLLPRGMQSLGAAEIAEFKDCFWVIGPFPAVEIATGEVGA